MWKQPQKLIDINNFAKFSKLFYEKQKKNFRWYEFINLFKNMQLLQNC